MIRDLVFLKDTKVNKELKADDLNLVTIFVFFKLATHSIHILEWNLDLQLLFFVSINQILNTYSI